MIPLAAIFVPVTLLAVIALVLAAGVRRARRAVWPSRLEVGAPLWPVEAALLAGAVMWLSVVPDVFVLLWRHGSSQWSDSDMAVVSCAAPLAALGTMLAADALLARGLIGRLGLSARRVARGVAVGAGAALIVCPLMFAAEYSLESLMEALHINHPPVVKVLEVLGSTPHTAIKVLIVVTAVVVAPIFEELFFRGHVQTLLAALFGRVMRVPGLGEEPKSPSATNRLAAIILTSLLFALFHEAWTSPSIFILALCLGYVYECTGNLWAAIALHATFNMVSITGFLVAGH